MVDADAVRRLTRTQPHVYGLVRFLPIALFYQLGWGLHQVGALDTDGQGAVFLAGVVFVFLLLVLHSRRFGTVILERSPAPARTAWAVVATFAALMAGMVAWTAAGFGLRDFGLLVGAAALIVVGYLNAAIRSPWILAAVVWLVLLAAVLTRAPVAQMGALNVAVASISGVAFAINYARFSRELADVKG